MDEQTKKQQRERVDASVRAFGAVLKDAGVAEYMVVAATPDGDNAYNAFASGDFSTKGLSVMLDFLFARMEAEPVAKILNYLLSQPAIVAKMVSFQAKVMAETAENLKAQAAASPEPAQPAPMVPDSKNKSWLN